jgi:hypothetical protein
MAVPGAGRPLSRRSPKGITLLDQTGVQAVKPLLFVPVQRGLSDRKGLSTKHIEQAQAVGGQIRQGPYEQPQAKLGCLIDEGRGLGKVRVDVVKAPKTVLDRQDVVDLDRLSQGQDLEACPLDRTKPQRLVGPATIGVPPPQKAVAE